MKLILVRPTWTTRRMILPPLGLGYISARAKEAGNDVLVYDAWLKDETPQQAMIGLIESGELWEEKVIIGVQVYQHTVNWTREFFNHLRLYGVNAKFIVGGPYVTALREDARIEMGADCAVIGEFEESINSHLDEILQGETLIEWTNWVDINEHPFPDWDSMNLPDYWPYIYSAGVPLRGKRVGFIQRTRGCPHKCTFCASGGIIMGKRVRFRKLSNVLEELDYLVERWDIDELWFQDDDVTINYKKGIELFKALAPYKLHIRLQMGIRVDQLTPEMLYWMKKAGVYYAGIGIESGNPRVLKRIKKGLDQERVKKGVEDLVKHDITVMGFFMFGIPTETLAEMEETVAWALKTKLHHAQFSIFIPYPGSEDYGKGSTCSPEKLLEVQRRATLRFYLRPRILYSILIHLKPKQLKAIWNHRWVKNWLRRK